MKRRFGLLDSILSPFLPPLSLFPSQFDRFIPNRAAMDFEAASDALGVGSSSDEGMGAARILAFKTKVSPS